MKAAAFQYHAPTTVDEARHLLTTLENVRLLAGGQSLMAMLNLRVATYDHLIDLGRIPDLVGIVEDDETIRIGAMTTQRAVEHSPLVARHCPLLSEAVHYIGHQQTRNRGTIGGSLCHLDPGAELPVIGCVLDVGLTIACTDGRRTMRFSEFPAGYLTSTLEADEVLAEISFSKTRPGQGSCFVEFNRRPADFAIVSVAAILCLNASGIIESASIAIGGVSDTPIYMTKIAERVIGEVASEGLFQRATGALNDIEFDGDSLYPPEFRKDIAGTLIVRCLSTAAQRGRLSVHA